MAENMFMTPHAPAQLGLNISDIIDVISGDKEYRESEMLNFAKGGAASDSVSSSVSQNDPDIELKRKAHVEIVEQPQQKALRFRYICEGRSAGSIPGVRSTAENKTYPTIKIVGYKGAAVVVVSCVTVDPPYRPHPHNLVGKEGCNKGVCTITIDNDSMECMFSNLGIQCVKKRDVKQALNLREEIRVDPFATGFAHVDQPIDLNAVRLCFQVFLRNGKNGRFTFPLKAAISDPIYDKKATCDLTITKLSDCSSCVSGGKEIILLCDKVTKEDIQIRFYEVKDDRVVWEAYGDFLASDVHKQFAIAFKTPKYKNLEVQNSVNCFIQLQRPSDKSTSEPRPFEYIPMNAGRHLRSFKRLRNNNGLFHRILGLDNPLGFPEDSLAHKNNNAVKLPVTTAVGLLRSASPPLLSQQPSTTLRSPTKLALTHTSHQSLDDIKQRMTASLDKKRPVESSPLPETNNKNSFWTDDISTLYSDTDILDEVLSQGSVNDLLSAVGDGFTVYEDVEALTQHTGEVNPEAIDALYGDASYASCYSNLEFAMGRVAERVDNTPMLPPKQSPLRSVINDDEELNIYDTPSGLPIHANKEALLKERGFMVNQALNDLDDSMFYLPVSDIMEEEEFNEVTNEKLPQTILDLFV